MRINIDLPDEVAHALNVMAVNDKTNRKNYIESICINHAGGGSKKEKFAKNRKSPKAKK